MQWPARRRRRIWRASPAQMRSSRENIKSVYELKRFSNKKIWRAVRAFPPAHLSNRKPTQRIRLAMAARQKRFRRCTRARSKYLIEEEFRTRSKRRACAVINWRRERVE